MSVTIEELQRMWQQNILIDLFKPNTFQREKKRLDEIDKAIEGFETYNTQAAREVFSKLPADLNIPIAKWALSYDGMKKEIEAQMPGKENLEAFQFVVNLLNLGGTRDPYFRIGSDNNATSTWEKIGTDITLRNAESYFASYNWFYQIFDFYRSLKISTSESEHKKLEAILAEDLNKELTFNGDLNQRVALLSTRFVTKYLWMLTNRDSYLVVYSLKSFYNLAPVFSNICKEKLPDYKNIDWGEGRSKWILDFDKFVEAWPKVSDELFKIVTKETFAEDSDAVKKERLSKFSRFLFVASLRETTTKNALELVKTGNRAIIIYGPPGTSKTYESERVAVALIKEYEKDKPISSLFSNVNGDSLSGENTDKENFEDEWRKTHNFTNLLAPQNKLESDTYKLEPNRGYYQIVQFHPSYCYQDFVGGIIPEIEGSKGLVYKLQSGIFKCFCDAARQAANENEDNPPPFVLVIDEINRADLSSVFGELLYALEYRDKPIQIPHFGEFFIPSNVYIIGTMNNVDKSLVTFDLALRRRFGFLKLMPDMNVLRSWNKQRIDEYMLEDYIAHCSKLNEKLCLPNDKSGLALQKDFQIGQAYFMKIADFCVRQDTNNQENASGEFLKITSFALERLWDYHIEPLLEEYLGVMFEEKETKSTLQMLKSEFCEELEQKE